MFNPSEHIEVYRYLYKQTKKHNQMKNQIIVCFHVGRGGRFYNAGFKTYAGEKDINQVSSELINHLFINDKDQYTDCDGNPVGLDVDNNGTGSIDFDGIYDTWSCDFIENCTEQELELIKESDFYKSPELLEWLRYNTDFCNHSLIDLDNDGLEQCRYCGKYFRDGDEVIINNEN